MKETPETTLTLWQNTLQVVKFAVFSIFAGVVEVIAFTLLYEMTSMLYWPSYLIALTLSVLYNFTVNRRFTFKSAANVPIAMLKIAGFYAVFTPISTYLGDTAEKSGVNAYIVLAVTMVFNLLLEYLFCRFVVYRGSINTNDLAKKGKTKN